MSLKSKIQVSLNQDLRKKYGVRSFPISKGDIVSIKVGGRKGEGGKVVNVDHRSGRVSVEGITIAKSDGKQEETFLDPTKLVITKLDFSRQDRLDNLKRIAAIKNRTIEIEEPEPEKPEAPETEVQEEVSEPTSSQPEEESTEEEIEEEDVEDLEESQDMEMDKDDNKD